MGIDEVKGEAIDVVPVLKLPTVISRCDKCSFRAFGFGAEQRLIEHIQRAHSEDAVKDIRARMFRQGEMKI